MTSPWQFWIDVGGTFTDCLAHDPEGRIHRAKVLSSGKLRGRGERTTRANELRLHGFGVVSDEGGVEHGGIPDSWFGCYAASGVEVE